MDHSWLAKQQFYGSVTNINIYHGGDDDQLPAMSRNPCELPSGGDFLAWDNMAWNLTGKDIKEYDESQETICYEKSTYNVPLPIKMTWPETKQSCNNLGNGLITSSLTEEELITFTTWFTKVHGPCLDIWTPFTDESEEGIFIDTNTGKTIDYLPWMSGQPNGGTLQNIVVLKATAEGPQYHDLNPGSYFCGSCTLDKTTIFSLWGRCQNTYLGFYYSHYKILYNHSCRFCLYTSVWKKKV